MLMCCRLITLFVFSCYANHSALHSFPTRRSSDHLALLKRALGLLELALQPRECVEARNAQVRSEEHTSELQSLRHLVCRLLLEKKKYQKPYSILVIDNYIV